MRNTLRSSIANLFAISILFVCVIPANAQTTPTPFPISKYFLYGSNQVRVNSSNLSSTGFIGSHNLITISGNGSVGEGIHSGGTVSFQNGNVVTGSLSAANWNRQSTPLGFSAGSSTVITENLDVEGDVSINTSGSSIGGLIRVSGNYAGPGSKTNLAPVLQPLPTLPTPTDPNSLGTPNTADNRSTLQPGTKYGNISGQRINLVFDGPGEYYINSIDARQTSSFTFNFKGSTTGVFKIYVKGGVNAGRVAASHDLGTTTQSDTQAASRILLEISGSTGFVSANGSSQSPSRWIGTIYAPNGPINLGSGTGTNSVFFGALWSGKGQGDRGNSNMIVTVNSGVNCNYVAFFQPIDCSLYSVSGFTVAGVAAIQETVGNVTHLTGTLPCTGTEWPLTATSVFPVSSYAWTTTDGYIKSGANTSTPSITKNGTYTVEATYANGCKSTVSVLVKSCVLQAGNTDKKGDENPEVGKVVDPTLTKFYQSLTNPNILDPFFTGPGEDPIVYFKKNEQGEYIKDADGNYAYILIDAVFKSAALIPDGLNYLVTNYNFEKLSDVVSGITGFTVTGWIPVQFLDELDLAVQSGTYFNTVYATLIPVSSGFGRPVEPDVIKSGGDRTMGSDIVRDAYGVNGNGVSIGVLSDSYGTRANASADVPLELPANNGLNNDGSVDTIVVRNYPFGVASDEGSAMMQIVYDIAPGARYKFRTGFISEPDMAKGIWELADQQKCNVIVDDITYITAAHYTDGLVTNAIKKVVTEKNVKYFTSAGNFSNRAVEASAFTASGKTYTLAGVEGQIHRFRNTGSETDILQQIKLNDPGPASYVLVLHWDDPYYSTGQGGTDDDLDIYLTDIAGNPILGYNRTHTPTTQTDPFEILPFRVGGATTINVMVVRASGPESDIKFRIGLYRGKNVEFLNLTDPTINRSTVIAHANSPYAMAVAAAPYRPYPDNLVKLPTDVADQFVPTTIGDKILSTNTDIPVESFSSLGNLSNGAGLIKPDFTGPDGVNTSVNLGTGGDIEGDNTTNPNKLRYNFYGTSAAAPHAAALSALILESKFKFRPDGIAYTEMDYAAMRSLLKTTATDINGAGDDLYSGSGLINGFKAVQTFARPRPTITKLEFIPIGTNSDNIDERAPGTPQTITIRGYNFLEGAKVYYGGTDEIHLIDPLKVERVDDKTITFLLENYDVTDPPVYVYNLPTAGLTNKDGGFSDGVKFLDLVKKNIRIKVVVTYPDPLKEDVVTDDQGVIIRRLPYIYYGEKNDTEVEAMFGYEFYEDGVLQDPLTLDLSKYGISGITLTSDANGIYDPGTYLVSTILPAIDQTFKEQYTYLPIEGDFLRIKKLPIKITPVSKEITFGDGVPTFEYEITPQEGLTALQLDAVNLAIVNKRSEIIAEYTSHIANEIAILEGVTFRESDQTIRTSSGLPLALDIVNRGITEANSETSNAIEVASTATANVALMASTNSLNPLTNKGMAEANKGITEVNKGVAEANAVMISTNLVDQMLFNIGMTEANRGITEANKGVTEVNRGITEANAGFLEMNKGLVEANTTDPKGGVYLANGILVAESADTSQQVTVANFIPFLNGIIFNRGIAEANRGLTEANKGMAEVNNGTTEVNGVTVNVGIKLNKGYAEANIGMAEANRGITEANAGVAEANSVEAKGGTFTGVGITYVEGTDGKFRAFVVESEPDQEFSEANKGVAEANRGLAEANKGLVEANSGLVEANSGGNPTFNPWEYEKLGVILHSSDFPAAGTTSSSQVSNGYKSVNAVSGITPGMQHAVFPAAFFTNKFDVEYGVGVLTVKKKDPTVVVLDGETNVTAQTVSTPYGTPKVLTAKTTGIPVDGSPIVITDPATALTYKAQGSNTDLTELPTNAGTYDVTASFNGNTLYKKKTASATLTIGKATPVITVEGRTVTYSGTPQAISATIAGVNGETLTPAYMYTGIAPTVYGPTSVAPTNAGSYNVAVSNEANSNYNTETVNVTLNIEKATPVITVEGKTVTYSGTPQSITGTIAGVNGETLTLAYSYSGIAPTVYAATSAAPTNAGSYSVAVSNVVNPNYNAVTENVTLTISKATPVITVTGKTVTYSGTAQSITGTIAGVTGETLTLAYSYSGIAPTVYAATSTAPTNAGSYNVAVTNVTNPNYNTVTENVTLTISKATPVITVTSKTVTYSGTAQSITGTIAGVTGETLTLAYSYSGIAPTVYAATSAAPTNAGSYNVAVSNVANPNYNNVTENVTLTISKATPVITVTGKTVTYSGTAQSITGTIAGVTGETLTLAYSYSGIAPTVYAATSTAPTNAGTYNVAVSNVANDNYNTVTQNVTLTISKATPVITATDPQSFTYNGSPRPVTASITGVNNETLTLTYSYSGTSPAYGPSETAPTGGGTYSVLISYAASTNYNAASKTITLNIGKLNPVITMNAPSGSLVYSGTAKAATGSVTDGSGNPLTPGLVITYSLQSGGSLSGAPINVGAYRATGTFTGNEGYNSGSNSVDFSITKFTPVISAQNRTVEYNGSPKSITGSITSANNEVLTISYTYSGIAPTVYAASSTAPTNKGTYNVALNYGGSGNYNPAATVNVTLTITGIPLTVKANDLITNNGATPVFTSTLTPSISGLTISYKVRNKSTNAETTNFSNLAAGEYFIIPTGISGTTSTGISAANYETTFVNGTLYVNPYGNTVKAVKPSLECVTDNGDGTYYANYSYSNTNGIDVWIPAGAPDNYIQESNPGAVLEGGLPPSVFKAGGGRFKIKFDGSKTITWILASFEKRQKTSSASSASSSSNKCGSNFVPVEGRVNFFTGTEMTTPDKAYPNPFTSRVIIEADLTGVSEKDIKVFDVTGREYRVNSTRLISVRKAELDLGTLISGQYMIRINSKSGQKVFRVIKQ